MHPESLQIDVLLPYYGDVDYMKAAASSVLNQSHSAWRLIVLDDGYPSDEPARWFGEISARDDRVVYERNAENLGANGNYRKALAMATAPVVVVMGADDIMLPNYLAHAAEAFTAHPDADVFECGVQVVDEHDRAIRPLGDAIKGRVAPRPESRTVYEGEELAVGLMRGNWTYFPSLAWKSETVQRIGFREGLDVVQDLALLCDVVADGGRMVFDPRLGFLYRRHSASDSSVRALDGRRFDEERRFYVEQAGRFEALGWRRAAREARGHLTSRLHALALVPKAVRTKEARGGLGPLLRHVVR
ncbi:glycosyltransferase family 2 protein [Tomitella cavernea]|uniref:Glycosyltransferase 2-like domain-containing protein n=1 Tax=Tomitella cavernea TaxID=1387982 RepID=A0ABP9CCF3_9ACTN|nr:glycosyltransferase family A protein [Tomitella cavernea]